MSVGKIPARGLSGLTATIAQLNALDGLITWEIEGGSDGQYLKTDGAGNLVWATPPEAGEDDHGALAGLDDHDHAAIYYSEAECDAKFATLASPVFTGTPLAPDHGAGTVDMLVNVCYSTDNPPAAASTTIGTLWIKYVA